MLNILIFESAFFNQGQHLLAGARRQREGVWGPKHNSPLDKVNNLGITYGEYVGRVNPAGHIQVSFPFLISVIQCPFRRKSLTTPRNIET